MFRLKLCTCVVFLFQIIIAIEDTDTIYHPETHDDNKYSLNFNPMELETEFWVNQAQDAIRQRMSNTINNRRAKNVIMFLGDGMSVPTLAAARALKGQLAGQTGEEAELSFETFPVAGLAKTYCVNGQVADSACSATAYLGGVKGNRGTIGVNAHVRRGDCAASLDPSTHVPSIASLAIEGGLNAGVVTTTRITHASPAGVFANTANRDWENDMNVRVDGSSVADCPDIAHQLVHGFPANKFKVLLGGGRRNFRPLPTGLRGDRRDLTREWLQEKQARHFNASYVESLQELRNVDLNTTDYLFGLFYNNHFPYNVDADPSIDPSLQELTEVAIKVMQKEDKGYFLFIEGGRIDHAHHENRAHVALDETLELSKAVERAMKLTSQHDTLIVVTADHAHVMSYNGFSPRGQDILGVSADRDRSDVPYMTLSYTNGPGFRRHPQPGVRPDVTNDSSFGTHRWRSHVDVPLIAETHGGDDVAVFAYGPQQQIFTGLYEQNQIPHLMAYAACLGNRLQAPACRSRSN